MSSELSPDGKGAVLNTSVVSSTDERRRAAVHVADRALYRSDLKRLLWALDLHNRPAPRAHPNE